MSSTTNAASRLASTIWILKWISIGFIWLTVLAAGVGGVRGAEIVTTAAGAAIFSLVVYVMWGWFEHTLRLLVEIAGNAGAGVVMPTATPGPSQAPAAAPTPSGGQSRTAPQDLGSWRTGLVVFVVTVVILLFVAWVAFAIWA